MFNSNYGKPDLKPEKREKKKPKPLSRVRTATGEAALFKALWLIRPHICNNCKDPLGNEAKAHFFSHDKPKSRGEQYRLNPNNVILLCFDCHYAKDFQGEEKFNKRKK